MKKQIFNIKKINRTCARCWAKSEDDLLLKLTEKTKYIRWTKIVNHFKNKTINSCKSRFRIVDQRYRKGHWSKKEDNILLSLVDSFGKSWKFISCIMKNRNVKQIRSRYINFIFHGINREKFSVEEDEILLERYPLFEKNWVQYTNYLNSRSPRQVENRFKSLKNNISEL